MDIETLVYWVPVTGLLALVFAWLRSAWIKRQDSGSERMMEIAQHIREGAMAFLGSAGEQPATRHGHHSPQFDIDEDILPGGAALLAGFCLR